MSMILDAPVPLLIGLDPTHVPLFSSLHLNPNENPLLDGVVLVDLDANTVHVGTDGRGAHLLPIDMPPRETSKLTSTLAEYGGCIYRTDASQSIKEQCETFPGNSHLLPIQSYPSEIGVVVSHPPVSRLESTALSLKETKVHINYQSTHVLRESSSSKERISIIDPANNANWTDQFDAKQIRYGFLRFFLSLFRDYHQSLIDQPSQKVNGGSSSGIKLPSSLSSKFRSETLYANTHSQFFATL
jgi:hypothetical protein